tara:strand:- start:6607 stop:7587 length:981 start_codon:yes stop_codon:yes gene_type:complete
MARHENYKILIGKDVARTAGATVATLADGEIAIVRSDMTVLAPADTIADSEYVYIVQGTTGAPRFSAKIQGLQVEKWTGTNYAAAVQQVAQVGAVAAGAGSINLVNSTEYVFSIIFTFDKVIGSERQLVRRFYYTSDATATQAEISAAMVAAINSDDYAKDLVVAAQTTGAVATDSGFTVTAKAQTYAVIDGYEQVTFKCVLDGGFSDGGVTTYDENQTAPVYGSGTFEHISDLERAALGYDGVTNLMRFPVPSYPVYAVAGTNYVVYAISHSDRHATANLNKDGLSPEMTLVAIPTGAAQKTNFQNEANPWFASCPGAFAALALV